MYKKGDTFKLQSGKVVLVLKDGMTEKDFNSQYDNQKTIWIDLVTERKTTLLVNHPTSGTYFYQPLPGDVCYNVMIGDEIVWLREATIEWCMADKDEK